MATVRVPLFPLNTVLMPGMVLPLHIFEPRYRLMMDHVLEGDKRFGIVLIREGHEVDEGAVPYDIGTIAEVTSVVRLEDGRMKISTTGEQRFRVTAFCYDEPYLSGDIEYLPDDVHPSEKLLELQAEVERLGLEYVTTILELHTEQVAHVQLPADPVTLSYKIAGLLAASQYHPTDAQRLLESPTLEHRLFDEVLLLRRELAILRRMSEITKRGGHSPN